MTFEIVVNDTILFMRKTLHVKSSSLEAAIEQVLEEHPNYRVLSAEPVLVNNEEL